MHVLGSVLGDWLRWLLLSSLLFAAIGFAEDPPDQTPAQTPDQNSAGSPPEAAANIAASLPRPVPLKPQEVLVRIDRSILDAMTPAEREALPREIAELIQSKKLFVYQGSGEIPTDSKIPNTPIEVKFSPLDPKAELETAQDLFEQNHPDGRWTPEMREQFRATSQISFPSKYPGVDIVRKTTALFGVLPLHKGADNIILEYEQNQRTGVYELVVNIPNSILGKEGAVDSAINAITNLGNIFAQFTGAKASVPAFTPETAKLMVVKLAEAEVVQQALQTAALKAATAGGEKLDAYHVALAAADTAWRKTGEIHAKDRVSSMLGTIRQQRGLDPKTEERIRNIAMDVEEAKFISDFLLHNAPLMQVARENQVDLRLRDIDLMTVVQKRVAELQTIHEQQWEKVRVEITSRTYTQLQSLFAEDPIGLAQATQDEVRNLKQENFFQLLLQDSGLDSCHPRAPGIGKLLVEHGKALDEVHAHEQNIADDLQKRRAEFEEVVKRQHPLKTFSSIYLNEETDKLLTAAYQTEREERNRDLIAVLDGKGLHNSARLLEVTLQELETVSKGRRDVTDAQIPAVALQWQMPAIRDSEWRVVHINGKWSGAPEYDHWVTSEQSFYRVRAMYANAAQAYRLLQRQIFLGQFWNGPVGVRSWITARPFPYQQKVDSDNGAIVPDTTSKVGDVEQTDPHKFRSTWWSNMGAVWKWGVNRWNSPVPRAIPRPVWNLYLVPTNAIAVSAGWIGWTIARAAGSAAVATATVVTNPKVAVAAGAVAGYASHAMGMPLDTTAKVAGAPVLLSVTWAPLWSMLATGFTQLVYDRQRARGTEEQEITAKKKLDTQANWLQFTGLAGGVGTGAYLDFMNFTSSSWGQLTQTGALSAATGLGVGLGLSALSEAQKHNLFVLPSKILAGIPYSIEKLSLSLAAVGGRAANAGRYLLGGAIKAKAEHLRDWAWRGVCLEFFVDTVFRAFGNAGLNVRDSFHMKQIQGPGIASQHYYNITQPLALAALWATLREIELDNWSERRLAENKEPRAHFVTSTRPTQALLSNSLDNNSSAVSKAYDKIEEVDDKYRENYLKEQKALLEPLFGFRASQRLSISGRIRFTEAQLVELRAQSTALVKRFFEDGAFIDMTAAQQERLWNANGVKEGNWSALAEKLLVTSFGEGVLQSSEGLDKASFAQVEVATAPQILQQMLDGRDLDVSDQVTIHPLPASVEAAQARTPFFGASTLCSQELLKQVERTPWDIAKQSREEEKAGIKPDWFTRLTGLVVRY